MTLELLFNQIDYVPTAVAAGAGARVAISDPGTLPDPADAGHYIQPNTETDFTLSLSTISSHSENLQEKLFIKYGTLITEMAGSNAKSDEERRSILSREFAKVNIYFETLKVEKIQEEVKYDFSKTLSDLGGATGLYLGICVVTFLEVLELLMSICGSLLRPKWLHSSEKVEDAAAERTMAGNNARSTPPFYPRNPLEKSFKNSYEYLQSHHI
ncbi:unnamed protein product [Notodromas monacha]|uniref:Uncharacterized protein n=1 Tax=Notodromas monacha TaxID=399045 RepID=A0A7R9BVW7_9CRUS|nr:unnamed protein product [Notodromas monacha]CAG0921550.1 unnamed protein product [Notodromas monacha]